MENINDEKRYWDRYPRTDCIYCGGYGTVEVLDDYGNPSGWEVGCSRCGGSGVEPASEQPDGTDH